MFAGPSLDRTAVLEERDVVRSIAMIAGMTSVTIPKTIPPIPPIRSASATQRTATIPQLRASTVTMAISVGQIA